MCIPMQLGWTASPWWAGTVEQGGLPNEEDGEPPERLLPAGSRDHVGTQRQQVVRQGHIESEAELQACRRDQSQLSDDPEDVKLSKPADQRHLYELLMVFTLGTNKTILMTADFYSTDNDYMKATEDNLTSDRRFSPTI